MAKITGYEVTATRPVSVDFPDGRAVSFRPGMRFTAHPTNVSVRRLLSTQDVRQLGPHEAVPPLPVKLGASRELQAVLKSRAEVATAQKAAAAKTAASKTAPPTVETVNLGSTKKKSTK